MARARLSVWWAFWHSASRNAQEDGEDNGIDGVHPAWARLGAVPPRHDEDAADDAGHDQALGRPGVHDELRGAQGVRGGGEGGCMGRGAELTLACLRQWGKSGSLLHRDRAPASVGAFAGASVSSLTLASAAFSVSSGRGGTAGPDTPATGVGVAATLSGMLSLNEWRSGRRCG